MKVLRLKKSYTDSDIIEQIATGSKEEDLCLKQLYKDNYKPIISFVLKNNGTEADAKEVLQNAIIVLYEKIKSGSFEVKAKLSTFLFSVAKNQWYTALKKEKRFMTIEEESDTSFGSSYQEDEYLEENKDKKAMVVSLMNQLQKDCKDILVYSIYQNYSMNEIAEMMGFKNEQIARNKKSKCLGYFKNLILKSPKPELIINVLTS